MNRQGWGYAIDYDKEIANDLKEIAEVERHVPLVKQLTVKEQLWAKTYGHLGVTDFLFGFGHLEERAALLGLNLEEVYDLAAFMEHELIGAPERRGGWYGRGEQISKQLQEQFGGADIILKPEAMLMRLRARLARHRRNKKRNGY